MNLRSRASEARALDGLSYILRLALPARIELAFRDRQSRPFARWGWEHDGGAVADQVGLEPTKLSRQLKRLLPLPLGALVYDWGMEDPGGFEPREHGLKVRSLSIRV